MPSGASISSNFRARRTLGLEQGSYHVGARGSKPGAGVPALQGGVSDLPGSIVASANVDEGFWMSIKHGMGLADRSTGPLVHQGEQPGPERRDRACPADDLGLAVDHDVVARRRIGVAGDIGNTAPGLGSGIG